MCVWGLLIVILVTLGRAGAGEHYALLVGIDQIPDIGSEFDLKYAESDAKKLRRLLLEEGFYAEEHIHLLTGSATSSANQARKGTIRSTIEDILTKELESDDVLLVYLAMHGTLIKEEDETKRAFLPTDALKGRASTYITDEELEPLKRL